MLFFCGDFAAALVDLVDFVGFAAVFEVDLTAERLGVAFLLAVPLDAVTGLFLGLFLA